MEASQINDAIKLGLVNANDISDGYHTFGELYEHRIRLFITLCYFISCKTDLFTDRGTHVWISQKHSDGTGYDGWFVMGINGKPGAQITYHLPMDRWEECAKFSVILDQAPEYDGHSHKDVLFRLQDLTKI